VTPKQEAPSAPQQDLAAYNRLVSTVQPTGVRLVSVRFSADPYPGGNAEAQVEERVPRWGPTATGFTAVQPLSLSGIAADPSGGTAKLTLELEIEIEYRSGEPMTEALFETFGQANLPINVRPFLREAVVNFVMRSGWPPLILPAFIRPSRRAAPASPDKQSPRAKTRRQTGRKVAGRGTHGSRTVE
jgi:hypothetical protein